jgi:hypothetical protein
MPSLGRKRRPSASKETESSEIAFEIPLFENQRPATQCCGELFRPSLDALLSGIAEVMKQQMA